MYWAKIITLIRWPLTRSIYKTYSSQSTKWSYIHNAGQEPLEYLTVGKILERTAQKSPNSVAVISKQQNLKLTYKDLLTQADKLAAGILSIGFEKGDRLGIWAPNMAEWIVTQMASARAGLVLVPLNPFYETSEIEYCINKVGMKGIICPEFIKDVECYEKLSEICKKLGDSEPGRLCSDNVPSLKSVIIISDKNFRGTYNYNNILDMSCSRLVEDVQKNQNLIRPDDLVAAQFTSGTTGRPKAIETTHFIVVNNSFCVGKRSELGQTHHTICFQTPFFHALGFAVIAMASINFGSTLVIPSTFYKPKKNLTAIRDNKCTIIAGTPTMYVDLVNQQKNLQFDINPQIAVTGGAPCSPVLFNQMRSVLKVKTVKSVYGMTEVLIVFNSLQNEQDEYKAIETVGYVGDHIEAKVVDTNGNVVPMGTPGELCVRGYSTMPGYWNDDAKTKETIDRNGWLHTQDQFILQEDGYGKIVGRLKDMIIRGGENIFPKEIEDLVNTHPDIIECHVIGLPDDRLGEEVCACVRVVEGAQLTLESLNQYCKGKLARYKIPSVLKIVDKFPKTQSGKIQKYKLQEQFSRK